MAKMTQVFYDALADVLYLSAGEPQAAISQELGNDMLLRRSIQTGEVVGLTILNLSARFQNHNANTQLPAELDVTIEGS